MNMNFFFILICTLISVSVQAECVRLTKDVRAKTQPDKIWVSFKKDDMFKVIKKSPDGKKVYAVKGTQKAVFLMTAVSEELCLHSVTANPVAPPPPPELTIKKPLVQPAEPSAVKPDSAPSPSLWSNVRWGAEYQMHANTSSANYRGLITTIPDASDVSSLQDPIIVDINRGAGSMLGLTGEYRYSDKIDLDARFGLRKLTYKYQQKANPGLSPVALNGLPTSEKSFDISFHAQFRVTCRQFLRIFGPCLLRQA